MRKSESRRKYRQRSAGTETAQKEDKMRNRKMQQELIKAKVSKEEKLNLIEYCGIKDPTPFEAVRNMIRRGESAADSRRPTAIGAQA